MPPRHQTSRRERSAGRAAGSAVVAIALALFATPGAAETPDLDLGPSPLEIRVNIPAFRLDAIVGDRVIASYPVTLGMPDEPTPDGRFVVDHAVWNPWWHPPAHRRPKDQVTPPGPRNPMGRVKLHFAADLYYLHGTAKTGELGRATSRGCVRLRNDDAIALATLVHEHAGPQLSRSELTRLIRNPGATRRIPVDRPVSLQLTYDLAEVRDGFLELHADVYRRAPGVTPGALIAEALARAGVTADRIDPGGLASASAAQRGQRVALATLLLPDDLPAFVPPESLPDDEILPPEPATVGD